MIRGVDHRIVTRIYDSRWRVTLHFNKLKAAKIRANDKLANNDETLVREK